MKIGDRVVLDYNSADAGYPLGSIGEITRRAENEDSGDDLAWHIKWSGNAEYEYYVLESWVRVVAYEPEPQRIKILSTPSGHEVKVGDLGTVTSRNSNSVTFATDDGLIGRSWNLNRVKFITVENKIQVGDIVRVVSLATTESLYGSPSPEDVQIGTIGKVYQSASTHCKFKNKHGVNICVFSGDVEVVE